MSPNATGESDSASAIRKKRLSVVASINRVKKYLDDGKTSENVIELQCRLELLEQYIEDAMKLQNKLESKDEDDDFRAELEELCVLTKARLKSLIAKYSSTSSGSGSQKGRSSRLPSIDLPKFDGKYSEYKNFIGVFNRLVHDNTSLPDIEKFNYLISCLTGEALSTVKAYQISEENYPKALANFKLIFDNNCLIFLEHISTLFEISHINQPSSAALRQLIDKVSAVHDSLLSLGDHEAITNGIFIHLVMSKVDHKTKSKWEDQLDYSKLPMWSQCQTVLNRRFQQLVGEETLKAKHSKNPVDKKSDQKRSANANHSFKCTTQKSGTNNSNCLYCNATDHDITKCSSYASLSVQQRYEYAKSVPLCINCLHRGHSVSKCNGKKCQICQKAHNQLLHRFSSPMSQLSSPSSQDKLPTSYAMHTTVTDKVILATAVIKVKRQDGEYILARTLLDSGSQINFITEDLAKTLKIKREKICVNLVGIGQLHTNINKRLHTTVKSRLNSSEFGLDFCILKTISSYQPSQSMKFEDWKVPANIQLADPNFSKSHGVDMLIGAELFFELMLVGQIMESPEHPMLQKTIFGWVVSGRCKQSDSVNSMSPTSSFHCSGDVLIEIDNTLKKFWTFEDLPAESKVVRWTKEQQKCEDHFSQNVKVCSDGRFEVKLPFKSSPQALGASFEVAKRRFLSLERRLMRDSQLRKMYLDFMDEYLTLGHMSIAKNIVFSSPHYFIPHQCVVRLHSTSTKLRVVFDASCRTATHVALNDILMVGPTIQEELFSTLFRFRFHKCAVTADITKMYRQISVHEDDRKYQLIVWRRSPTEPLQICRLNTVTYGTAPAPFLAIRCLVKLAEIHMESNPQAAHVLKHDFYVDDMLTGAGSVSELQIICNDVSSILQGAGFTLAKWFSNCPDINTSESTGKSLNIGESESTKTLGIRWFPSEDEFQFELNNSFTTLRTTKRNILAVSARLFDPLGLLGPLLTKVKILLQELWIQKLDWDESVPIRLETDWEDFKKSLLHIQDIRIPRYVQTDNIVPVQIHVFADASMRAYGACLYIRSVLNGEVKTFLLTSKSRVAPIKRRTLPQLELCAAHIASNLLHRISSMVTSPIEKVVCWSDSEIVLYWLKMHASALSVFVGNRVAEIQDWSKDAIWRHIPTKENPADLVSRGCSVEDLKSNIWLKGPPFLLQSEENWPINPKFQPSAEMQALEVKKHVLSAVVAPRPNEMMQLIENVSCHKKMLRIMGYILRFVSACRKSDRASDHVLSPEELDLAFYKTVEIIQRSEYFDTIEKIRKKQNLGPQMQKLNPFLHEFSQRQLRFCLLRVGGRLLRADIPYNAKFPLLLGKHSHFVEAYLRSLHIKSYHVGPSALLGLLNERIWIINARELCRKTVRNCLHCFRYKPRLLNQIMGQLPADRIRVCRPFAVCGVDFCGPILTTMKIRGKPPYKSYIAVFVCFATKAVHLELVSDLSTDTFLACFQRFAGRRGLPHTVHCDNGTNFVGASNKMKEFAERLTKEGEIVRRYAAEEGCNFMFIPPRAPHFGGLWEAAVKSAKGMLLRTVGNTLLTADELTTFLIGVEAVLNSRPISSLSPDPNDGQALTPGHLLIGGPLRAPPAQKPPEKMSYSRRWQLVSFLKHEFWQKWSKEYVRSLLVRSKWTKEHNNATVGQLVLIAEDHSPPQTWITGRITAVHAGPDGKVRVVDVQTATGIKTRAIHKLAPLPVD